MPHTDVIAPRSGFSAAAIGETFAIFGARLRLALVGAAKAWNARRAERALMEMPDHLLKDIGIGRAGIRQAVRQGRI
jgi:uncharacterized protein YjiS (DUF1127 family)